MGARSKRRARRRAAAAPDVDVDVDIGFDVRKRHQSVWTGCLGALYIVALFWGYAVYRVFELPGGGPPVAELFSYLPAGFRFRGVSRDFFDILALVALLFQFMATWELLSGPRARAADASFPAATPALARGPPRRPRVLAQPGVPRHRRVSPLRDEPLLPALERSSLRSLAHHRHDTM